MSDNENRPGSSKQTMVAQVRQAILDLIAERGLDAGDKLDTESALSERFGVSRPTIREALKSLEQEGVLNAVQGQGRFISSMGSLAVERPITRYESITEVLTALGYDIVSSVLSVTEAGASAVEAKALKIEPGILVNDVGDESIAAKAGLRPGDVIVAAEGRTVSTMNDLQRSILPHLAERAVELQIVREKKARKLIVKW